MTQPYGFGNPKYIRKAIHALFTHLDFDHDGVPNLKDCRPLNPFKQDAKSIPVRYVMHLEEVKRMKKEREV